VRAATIICAMVLAACAGKTPVPEPRVELQEVPRIVQVPCTVTVDPRPDYPDSKDTLRGFGAARELRGPYEDQLEAALAKCR
jgi:hypothetical protein